ncbi:glycoside hydrolase family 18 protein [Xylariaceae sp. FL0804]|nr:glycoside hydrolase family 18 protein [Xylariaceae sp. FL0804]
MPSSLQLTKAAVAGVLALAPVALAGFDASSSSNIAVYWGQNSYGQDDSQYRLSYYCSNTEIDIIPLAFLDSVETPITNFANAGNNCTTYSGTQLLDCPQLEEDIPACQALGKTIMLSIGGATYTEGGFSSDDAAVAAAQNIWGLFGPDTSNADRPFGSAVVDGFDFDLESTNSNFAAFANELRALADADASKTYYLSAAPQCPYPDAADNAMLDGAVSFDFVMVQFYNNYCGVTSYTAGSTTQNNFNFATWDTWAQETSLNKDVKVLLGVPANTGAAGSGYESASDLAAVIDYCKEFASFGGVMMWDMSQLWANAGFLDGVYDDLTSGAATTTIAPTGTATATTMTTSTRTATSATSTSTGTVAQWGQCGGEGYTGPTECASPYTCQGSYWWMQCE